MSSSSSSSSSSSIVMRMTVTTNDVLTMLITPSISCLDTKDCLTKYGHNEWCKSGVVCIQSYCHLINDYPCNGHELCNETQHQCSDKRCGRDQDCDDGQYCNGNEKCNVTSGLCLNAQKPVQCPGGECNETLKECIFIPRIVSRWRNFKEGKNDSFEEESMTTTISNGNINSKTKTETKQVLKITKEDDVFQINHHNSTSPSSALTSTQWTIIICIIIFIVGLLFVVSLIAMFVHAGTDQNIYVSSS